MPRAQALQQRDCCATDLTVSLNRDRSAPCRLPDVRRMAVPSRTRTSTTTPSAPPWVPTRPRPRDPAPQHIQALLLLLHAGPLPIPCRGGITDAMHSAHAQGQGGSCADSTEALPLAPARPPHPPSSQNQRSEPPMPLPSHMTLDRAAPIGIQMCPAGTIV